MVKRRISITILLLLAIGGIVLAFWAAGVFVDSDEDEILIHVGSANDVFTTISINGEDQSNLVPIGTTGNSPAESVEYVVIPINILWTESGSNWAEGMQGNFLISPTVELLHSVSTVNQTNLNKAIILVNVGFITTLGTTEEMINQALVDAKGINAKAYIDKLAPFGFEFDEFEVTLTIDVKQTIYLVAFIERPDVNTFSYIYQSTILINTIITLKEEQTGPIPFKELTTTFKMSASGTSHTIALDEYGRLWSWGNNASGQLGDNTTAHNPTPTLIPETIDMKNVVFKHITASTSYSIAIDIDGRLWGWGSNFAGQQGTGPNADNSTNVLVPTLINAPILNGVEFVDASASVYHVVAIDSDGRLWSWGSNYNNRGLLGNPFAPDESIYPMIFNETIVPTQIPLTDQMQGVIFKKVSARQHSTIAIDLTGRLWSWGYDGNYSLMGRNTTGVDIHRPTLIPETDEMKNVEFIYASTSYNHVTVIDSNNQLWAWGAAIPCGLGETDPIRVPTKMTITSSMTGVEFVQVCTDNNHVLALDSLGRLWSWGNNDNGKTGLGTTDAITYSPVLVETIQPTLVGIRFIDISCYRHNIAIDTLGRIWTWGENASYGQLGNGLLSGDVLIPTLAFYAYKIVGD